MSYFFQLNSLKFKPGTPVEVELARSGSEQFKGYMVQARKESDDSVVGAFEIVSEDAQYVKCGDLAQSAVTHVSSAQKVSVKMKWIPPTTFEGKVKIVATFVKDYYNYWVKVPSEIIEIVKSSTDSEITF